MMGVAAIMIVLCHSLLPPSINYGHPAIKFLLVQGNRGVDIFLLVSGIGIYFSLEKFFNDNSNRIWMWYKKRLMRIMPIYLLLATVYYMLTGIRDHNLTLSSLAASVSTYHYWMGGSGFWYIAVLIPLYFISPLYYKCLNKLKYKFIFTVFISSSILLIPILGIKSISIFARCVPFFIGFYFGYVIKTGESIGWGKIIFSIVSAICIIKLLFPDNTYYEWLFIFPLILFLPSLFQRNKTISKGSTWLGKRSLEIYLCNGILMVAVSFIDWSRFPIVFHYGNYFRYSIVIAMCIILADLSYNLKNTFNLDKKS
ncbi:MAG: acyltransferase family protein [Allobaculum sp.]|nr:acyltransferase family protein [Allobaculum sp.]